MVCSKRQVDLILVFYTDLLSVCQVSKTTESLRFLQKYHGERFLVSISVL